MAKNPPQTSLPQVNLIASGTKLEGTIHTKDDIRVSGHVDGALNVHGKAIVAPEGIVDGDLHADDADVAGTVTGELRIKGRLVLKSTANVKGTIHTARLIVEEGATFDGQCVMGQLDEKRAAALNGGATHQDRKQVPSMG